MIPSEKLTHPSPLVSVIMPAHNREHSLSESIQSVINQTYQHWELLVIDDRSTDGTARVVQSLANTDERIRYLKNENKQGPAGARNWGITHANGSYISFLDSDDLWLPHHLNECLSVLTVEDKKFCSAKWYEKKGTEITPSGFVGCVDYLMKTFSENKGNSNNYVFGPEIFEYLIVRDFYPFHISTVVVHKEVLERVGLFNEKLFGPEDSDLLFKIVLEYGLCIINNFHSIWVQGEDNIHFFKNSTQDFEKQTLPKVLKNRLNHLILFKEQIRLIRANFHKLSDANRLIHLKRFEIAFNCFYLSRLCKHRHFGLYLTLFWKMSLYKLLTSNQILKDKSIQWADLKKPRKLFEGLPGVSVRSLTKRFPNNVKTVDAASSEMKNFWFYLERDVVFLTENDSLLFFNRKTGDKLFIPKVPNKIQNLQSNMLMINHQDLYDKSLRRFLNKVDHKHVGGLVDTNSFKNILPIINTAPKGAAWI